MREFFNLAVVTYPDNPKFVLQVHLTQPVMESMILTRRLPVPVQATYHARLRSFFNPPTHNAFMQARQIPAADKEGIFLECLIFPTAWKMLILSKPDCFALYADWRSLLDKLGARENAVVSMWHCPSRDHQVGDEQIFVFRVDDVCVLKGEALPRIPDEHHLHVGEN